MLLYFKFNIMINSFKIYSWQNSSIL